MLAIWPIVHNSSSSVLLLCTFENGSVLDIIQNELVLSLAWDIVRLILFHSSPFFIVKVIPELKT